MLMIHQVWEPKSNEEDDVEPITETRTRVPNSVAEVIKILQGFVERYPNAVFMGPVDFEVDECLEGDPVESLIFTKD